MALNLWHHFTAAVNNAADRILALGQNKLAKSAVLIWLILSSIFSGSDIQVMLAGNDGFANH
jgi:hypothetical protein